MYQLYTENGYIISIVHNVPNGNLTEEEYQQIKAILSARPTPPNGYGYRMKTDLTWELYELPPVTEEITDDDPEKADMRAALTHLGVEP